MKRARRLKHYNKYYNSPLGIQAILSLHLFIQEKRLSEALEVLEECGYTGNTALSLLGILQRRGGAV